MTGPRGGLTRTCCASVRSFLLGGLSRLCGSPGLVAHVGFLSRGSGGGQVAHQLLLRTACSFGSCG
ncbi:hypothetical protein ACFPM0_05840 [Pseudonocardia sulfidoxydans]|uniref:hypothetical protein n=1 Tax=Pseudonocardia sulfidoxydans TaxID=54011 RepID=UPI00362031E2